jgi:hypothetical protein
MLSTSPTSTLMTVTHDHDTALREPAGSGPAN